MKIRLPEHVKQIIHRLQREGFDAYAVGGCVRDTLLGRIPQDWDITTSAKPQEVKALFSHTIDTGIEHGTVTVMLEHTGYEVTTYRIDGEYEDARHPSSVTFTGNLVEDLKRRDFTINAMAYNDEAGLVDVFGGAEDLKRKVIRCVGNPIDRFTEDALRMLRALRFAAQLGFSVEEETKKAAAALAENLKKVSAERIQIELVKLLVSEHPEEIRQVYELVLSRIFLPEFDRMMVTEQNTKHHCYSVGEHTIRTLQEVPADRVLRLTMLLHDVAKPVCRTTDEKGQDHFKGHPAKGAEMAREILRRLKFDNATIDRVCLLVRYHDDRPKVTPENVRRAASRIGADNMEALFAVKRGDMLGQSLYEREEKLAYIDEYETLWNQIQAENQCVRKKELAVNGKDLITLGMKQGKEIGEMINRLFDRVLEEPELNTQEKLLAIAKAILQDNSADSGNK